MAVVFRILVVPYFFFWLINEKVPFGGQEVLVSFVYGFYATLVILALLISRHLALHRSSFFAIAPVFLLIPTLVYQATGITDRVAFDHFSGFPTGPILKISLIAMVFVAFNELLARRYLTVDFIFKSFLVAVLISIPKYLIESYELILTLNVFENRPYPDWVGGWNTYSFVLSLAFVVLLGPLRLPATIRYSLLILILAVMLTTLSRGGLLALVAALMVGAWSRLKLVKSRERVRAIFRTGMLISFGVAAIMSGVAVTGIGEALQSRFIDSFIETQLGDDYLQSVSSGRSVFWVDTLSRFTNPEHVYQWFVGYGVGHFAYPNVHGLLETEMASQYIYWIYEYGLIIGLGLPVLMFKVYSLVGWDDNHPWARAVKMMFVIYLASSFVEEFIYTTQVGWLIGVGAAIFLHILRGRGNELSRRGDFAHEADTYGHAAMNGYVRGHGPGVRAVG